MQAHIEIVKPEPIELHELRAGDNFELKYTNSWVLKVVSGVKQFTDEETTDIYAVFESSGEVMRFDRSEMVYPLLESTVSFKYDFNRKFEEEREG